MRIDSECTPSYLLSTIVRPLISLQYFYSETGANHTRTYSCKEELFPCLENGILMSNPNRNMTSGIREFVILCISPNITKHDLIFLVGKHARRDKTKSSTPRIVTTSRSCSTQKVMQVIHELRMEGPTGDKMDASWYGSATIPNPSKKAKRGRAKLLSKKTSLLQRMSNRGTMFWMEIRIAAVKKDWSFLTWYNTFELALSTPTRTDG